MLPAVILFVGDLMPVTGGDIDITRLPRVVVTTIGRHRDHHY